MCFFVYGLWNYHQIAACFICQHSRSGVSLVFSTKAFTDIISDNQWSKPASLFTITVKDTLKHEALKVFLFLSQCPHSGGCLSVLWPLTNHTEQAVIRTEAQTVLQTLFSTPTACTTMPCVNTSSSVSGVFVWPIMLLLVLHLCPNTCQEPPACLLLSLPHASSLYSVNFTPVVTQKENHKKTQLTLSLI